MILADDLNVAGFEPFSSCDWPGRLVATVFLQGCPWDCGYCHNAAIIDPRAQGESSWAEVRAVLARRRGLLDGAVHLVDFLYTDGTDGRTFETPEDRAGLSRLLEEEPLSEELEPDELLLRLLLLEEEELELEEELLRLLLLDELLLEELLLELVLDTDIGLSLRV